MIPTRSNAWRVTLLALVTIASVTARAADPEHDPTAGAGDEENTLWQEVQRLYETAKAAGEKLPADMYEWVRQDLDRVGDWEYKVVEQDARTEKGVEALLNELGGERWECFYVNRRSSRLTFFLKRPVKSYIRSIPHSDLLKLLPGGGSDDEPR